jgi:branched-chain amino acid transport system ATP-binding protein
MATPADALELRAVTAGHGDTVVLEDFSLRLEAGRSLAILGRNGAGKTTLLATLMGRATLHGGDIRLHGASISLLPIHRRNALGLGYVPQEREIFASLTVEENLAVAARPGRWAAADVFALFPRLAERTRHFGSQLSGGEQQMLAVGRALVGNPSVLLLDEPSEGLAPRIVAELHAVFLRLRDEGGMAMVLVEQHVPLALSFSERCLVVERGRAVYDGPAAKLKADPALLNSLLGVAG